VFSAKAISVRDSLAFQSFMLIVPPQTIFTSMAYHLYIVCALLRAIRATGALFMVIINFNTIGTFVAFPFIVITSAMGIKIVYIFPVFGGFWFFTFHSKTP